MKRNYYAGYISGVTPDGNTVTKGGDKVCPICGKKFYITCGIYEWCYQIPSDKGKSNLFCTYTCMRKAEKANNIYRNYEELDAAMKAKEEREKILYTERCKRRYGRRKTLEELDAES